MSSLIVRLRRLCSSSSTVDPKKPTKQLAQAASHVIKFLAAQPYVAGSNYLMRPEEQEQKGTLVHCVLKMLEEKQTPLNVLQFFRQMFDPKRGVVLPAAYSGQQRIKRGSSFVKRFSFLPNRVVTPLVFNILTAYDYKYLLYGDSGISKTSNIVFYCYLSRLITLYDFSHERVSQFWDINRVIYLSYYGNCKEAQMLQQLNQQLPSQIKSSTFLQFQNKVNQLFNLKGLQGRVVLDQFNTLARLAYDINFKMSTTPKSRKLQKQMEKTKAQIDMWMNAAQSIFARSPVLYNCSKNIQRQLLNHQMPDRITFNLNHHTPIPLVFVSVLHDKVGKKQTLISEIEGRQQKINREWVDCILFQVLKDNHIEQDVLEQVRDLCMKEVGNQLLSVLTPLRINQLFKGFKLKTSSPEQIKKQLFNQLQQQHNESKDLQKQKTQVYLQKRKMYQLTFLTLKYRLFLQQQQGLKKTQWLPVQKQLVQAAMALDRNLFLIQRNGSQVRIKSIVSAERFLSLTADVSTKLYASLHSPQMSSLIFLLAKNDPAITGKIVEGYLLDAFRSHKVAFSLKLGDKLERFQAGKPGTFDFIHFNDQRNFQTRFIQLISLARQSRQKGKCFVGLPVDSQWRHSSNSQSIDFLLASFDGQKFEFTSVDVKVSKVETKIKECADKANTLIKGMQHKDIRSWRHLIIHMCSERVDLKGKVAQRVQLADLRDLAESLQQDGVKDQKMRLLLDLLIE